MTYLDTNVGVVYLIAVSSLTTLAIFMAGWASNNHYALLGSMRTVAMMISYEIPLSIALLSVVLLTGSMQLSEIVAWQSRPQRVARRPAADRSRDLLLRLHRRAQPHPERHRRGRVRDRRRLPHRVLGDEVRALYAVELGNALLVAALFSTFFLGGWTLFGLEEWVPGYLILFGKISAAYFLLVWLRGTLPRFRLDQLMRFAWQYLIPLALFNLPSSPSRSPCSRAGTFPGCSASASSARSTGSQRSSWRASGRAASATAPSSRTRAGPR